MSPFFLISGFIWFQVRDKCKDLVLNNETLLKVKDQLLVDIKKGLGKDTHAESVVKCFPTYVQDLPNGKGECDAAGRSSRAEGASAHPLLNDNDRL